MVKKLNEEQMEAVLHKTGPAMVLASAGSGKCLARGTMVLMFNGEKLPVEKVEVGDLLMGPDSKPRGVVSLGRGFGPMFQVTPDYGLAFTANGDHILVLALAEEVVELPINAYLALPRGVKRKLQAIHVGVDYKAGHTELPGWMIGRDMVHVGLGKIDQKLLRSNATTRWGFLGSVVDKIGSYCRITRRFKLECHSSAFRAGVTEIARSLGLHAIQGRTNEVQGTYPLYLIGDIQQIPQTIFHRVKPTRLKNRITIKRVADSEFFGFQITGDGRFVLGDYQVTHNTTILTHRVEHLINQGEKPSSILGITFTNKAANELLSRIPVTLDFGGQPRVSTIHSLALSLIRKNPIPFGFGPTVTPLDEYDQKEMLKSLKEQMKLPEEYKIWDFVDRLQFHRARGVGFPADYTQDVIDKSNSRYSGRYTMTEDDLRLWKAYVDMKLKSSVLDFDDMLHFVVRRFRDDEKWKASVGKHINHVLVDEDQDTSTTQWELVNHLFRPDNHNAFLVGDLAQSIFGFAGASPSTLYSYATEGWRGQKVTMYNLKRNHRSTPEIVALANKVQTCMSGVIPNKMISHKGELGERGFTGLIQSPDQISLAEEIAAKIKTMNAQGCAYKDMCILIRSGSQAAWLEPALVKRRIPYIVRGAAGFLQSKEVKDIMAYLRMMVNPSDVAAFARSVSTPKRGIGPAAVEELQRIADKDTKGDLLQACRERGRVDQYTKLFHVLGAMKDRPVECVDYILNQMKYLEYLKTKECKGDRDRYEFKVLNLTRLKETLDTLVNSGMTLEDIVFQLSMNSGEKDEDSEKLVVSTIHKSKGLEWDSVFVYGAYEGQMPHKFSTSAEDIEEERRLFFVAVTRARSFLMIGVPGEVVTVYNQTTVQPSRFLYETGILKR